VGQGVGAGVEVVVVVRLIDSHAPEDMEGWFQSRRIMRSTLSRRDPARADRRCCASRISSGREGRFRRSVDKMARLRVMARCGRCCTSGFAQDDGVLTLHAGGHSLAHPGEGLMTVEARSLTTLPLSEKPEG